MQNVQQTIISQYANSPNLTALINYFNAEIDPSANIAAFLNNIWNVATATGYGLDVWGRIVGVSRVLQVGTLTYLGLSHGTSNSGDSLNVAPFYNAGTPTTSNYALTDPAFRTLIYAKALTNICNGSIPAINNVLMLLFGSSGVCYCTDGGNMTMTYHFTFVPMPVQLAIIAQSGALPKPAGVSVNVVHP
jgi:hypothetical protein